MSIWSKVLVGLILVLTLPLFYLSMRLLITNAAWRRNINDYQDRVKIVVNGRPPQASLDVLAQQVRDASVALHDVMVDRGRVWRNVKPERAFNSNTGKGTVTVEAPTPHRITPNMVLYLFDPNAYLGEFLVTEAAEKTVSLEPALKMSDRQLKQLTNSAGDWTLCEVMPIDRADLFAGIDQAELEKLLPADKVSEYLRSGKEAAANDPPERILNGKYERKLTDYNMLFHEMDRQISVAADLNTAAAKDAASLEAAVKDAKEQVAFHQAEIADLKKEVARSQGERDMLKNQQQALTQELATTRGEMKAAFQENKRLAREWAKFQTAIAEARN